MLISVLFNPYIPEEEFPTVISFVFLTIPFLAKIPAEFAPDKVIVPLLVNVTTDFGVVSLACARAIWPACVPVIVLLLVIDELEISIKLYGSLVLSKFTALSTFKWLWYSINVLYPDPAPVTFGLSVEDKPLNRLVAEVLDRATSTCSVKNNLESWFIVKFKLPKVLVVPLPKRFLAQEAIVVGFNWV